jgi:RecJ-like exonuclease
MIRCPGCDGTGEVTLFTSRGACDICGGLGRALTAEERAKQKIIAEYIRTPEGRRKLAASISPPVRCGGLDYGSER